MRHSSVIASCVVAAGLSLALVACKGETITKADPATLSALDQCNKDKASLTDYKKQLEASNIELQNKQGSGAQIVVSFEGTLLTVRPPREGEGPHPIPDKMTQAASEAFRASVEKSRGGIQKCYQAVLKKDTTIQAKTITLIMSTTFSGAGVFVSASYSPSLGDVFDTCMRNVAQKWTIPASSPTLTFVAPVALTPT